jgi:pimeloyl-ACP methyl ester carboxylesterase
MKNFLITLLFLTQISLLAFSQGSLKNIKFGSSISNGKYATIDGIKLYYEIYGKGTPLILLHGGLGSIANFEKCIPGLAAHYKVIALDSPGHGRSGKTNTLSYNLLSDYISKFIDHLDFDSIYVMGWSDGGVVGLLLAAERPDKVKKLIAVGANTRLDGLSDQSISWTQNEMITSLKNDKEWVKYYLSITPDPENIDNYLLNTQKMWLTDVYIPETKLRLMQVPTMLVQGDRDEIKIDHIAEVYRQIQNGQLCILPNTSHFVFSEKPNLINSLAFDFFGYKKK